MQSQTRLRTWGSFNKILALMSLLAAIVAIIGGILSARSATGWYAGMAVGGFYFIILPLLLVAALVSAGWVQVSQWQYQMEPRGRTVARFQTLIALLLVIYLAISATFAIDSEYAWTMTAVFVPIWAYALFGVITGWPSITLSALNVIFALLPCLLIIGWNAIRWSI